VSYRKKIVLILFLVVLIPVILGSGIYFTTISRDLMNTQNEQATFTARAATNSISLLTKPLEQGVQTYGFWADAQTAASSKDSEWFKENVDIAKSSYSLDFGFTTDASGVVLDSFGSESFSGNESSSPLLKPVQANSTSASGLYEINNKLALVGVCQILDNDGKWEKAGYHLPLYNRNELIEKTKKHPVWIHFGAGNILRAFQANVVHNHTPQQ
jgi:sensor domain CHASE-containing protein